ncbi:MAG TPA: SpaA isopeptide-forming pilin-related protein, partial [Thermomicrobiales bacterium]|nr:SpaA isopeptide-forming pilin-related protein [Thermomicrobiales bacterium]
MQWTLRLLRLGAMITLVLGFSVIMVQTAFADDAATPVVTTTSDGTSDAGGAQDAGDAGTADSETTDESGDGAAMDADNGNGTSTTDPLTDASPTADESGADDATEPPPAASPPADDSAGAAATDGAPPASSAPSDLKAADQTTGTVVAVAQDDSGNPIGYACFNIYRDNGDSLGRFITNRCDWVDGPLDGSATFTNVPTGNLVLLLSQAGLSGQYVAGEQMRFTLATGETKTVVITAERGGRTVEIDKVDENGDPLGGACFNIVRDAGGGQLGDFVTSNCDGPIPNGPFDGVTLIPGLPAGDYVAVESRVPDGYVAGPSTSLTIPAQGTGTVTITVQNERGGSLIIHKVDEHGDPLPGACFQAFRDDPVANSYGFSCDALDGANDGDISFLHLPVGDLYVAETFVPNGYRFGGSRPVTIVAGETTELTFQDEPGGQTLRIHKVDGDGKPLTSSCFQVRIVNGDGTTGEAVAGGCDSFDGANDGLVTLAGLNPGDYLLEETYTPDGYVKADDVPFTIVAGSDLDLTVTNSSGGAVQYGSLIIKKVDENGNPLPGACFALFASTGDQSQPITSKCDGSNTDTDGENNGSVPYLNNVRGTFLVRETQAPSGYTAAADQTVTINAGETVIITFVDSPIESGGTTEQPTP